MDYRLRRICKLFQSLLWRVPLLDQVPMLLWPFQNLGRRLNTGEILRLQGFDVTLPTAVPDPQLRMLLGNSMSLNVICRIFCYLLPAAGLSDGLRDSFLDTDTGSSLSPIKPCVKRHRLA